MKKIYIDISVILLLALVTVFAGAAAIYHKDLTLAIVFNIYSFILGHICKLFWRKYAKA